MLDKQAQLDISRYPGLQGMYHLTAQGLVHIDRNNHQYPDEAFNRHYGRILGRVISTHTNIDDTDVLGWLVAPEEEEEPPHWKVSTLQLSAAAFEQLSGFEIAMDEFMHGQSLAPRHPLARAMSVYEGMRKLAVYGLVLGFTPLLMADSNGSPMIIKLLNSKYDDEMIKQLRQRILDSGLFNNCSIKPFIDTLLGQGQ